MGNADTKLNFRKAVVQLTSKTQPVEANDDDFWDQFWSETVTNVQDVFALVPGAEIRALREESPNNLATLVYKAVEKLVKIVDSSCRTQREQQTALNCARLLTRIIPYMLEDPEWHGFFWSSLPAAAENESIPLAQSLVNAVCDLLFCPDFTVTSTKRSGPERAEELSSLDSCEYIWAGGVGFARSPPRVATHDAARTDLLRLLLAAASETIYVPPQQAHSHHNKWIAYLTSPENRHALPLFTSLLNTVCSYDPVGLGLPYNHLLFSDTLEPLVEVALQILIVTLDHDTSNSANQDSDEQSLPDNLFINYLSRIHRDEDFYFILRGVTRLLNNPLAQTYLPNSAKKVMLHQELLVLFWKMCDYNKKFMYYVLKSSDVLEVLVPILYHLNDSRADQCFSSDSRSTSAESVAETPMEGSHPAQPAEPGTLNATLPETPGYKSMHLLREPQCAIAAMTERESAHPPTQPTITSSDQLLPQRDGGDGADRAEDSADDKQDTRAVVRRDSMRLTSSGNERRPSEGSGGREGGTAPGGWKASAEWVSSWRAKLPLQTIMRLLQVLVPQVEKICIDKGLTDESEILRFLQHGTLVGLLPVPHPILIRKYQANAGTAAWFRTYMWGVIYIRNVDPPIWYDTNVKLFEIQRV
ncbi:protein HID1 [Hyposmocoma kahamanoa]|uniref:protein HID1 n=1 Tax=Hyposmocoma kahamanoa TaxID=1477025 RepID=UPI000E6D76E2|nr:protein HID1 [Hyposmocoma kahamanoa]